MGAEEVARILNCMSQSIRADVLWLNNYVDDVLVTVAEGGGIKSILSSNCRDASRIVRERNPMRSTGAGVG